MIVIKSAFAHSLLFIIANETIHFLGFSTVQPGRRPPAEMKYSHRLISERELLLKCKHCHCDNTKAVCKKRIESKIFKHINM